MEKASTTLQHSALAHFTDHDEDSTCVHNRKAGAGHRGHMILGVFAFGVIVVGGDRAVTLLAFASTRTIIPVPFVTQP